MKLCIDFVTILFIFILLTAFLIVCVVSNGDSMQSSGFMSKWDANPVFAPVTSTKTRHPKSLFTRNAWTRASRQSYVDNQLKRKASIEKTTPKPIGSSFGGTVNPLFGTAPATSAPSMSPFNPTAFGNAFEASTTFKNRDYKISLESCAKSPFSSTFDSAFEGGFSSSTFRSSASSGPTFGQASTLTSTGTNPITNTRDMITSFYQTYNPAKTSGEIDSILVKYAGREEVLFKNLAKKYTVDVSIFGISASHDSLIPRRGALAFGSSGFGSVPTTVTGTSEQISFSFGTNAAAKEASTNKEWICAVCLKKNKSSPQLAQHASPSVMCHTLP